MSSGSVCRWPFRAASSSPPARRISALPLKLGLEGNDRKTSGDRQPSKHVNLPDVLPSIWFLHFCGPCWPCFVHRFCCVAKSAYTQGPLHIRLCHPPDLLSYPSRSCVTPHSQSRVRPSSCTAMEHDVAAFTRHWTSKRSGTSKTCRRKIENIETHLAVRLVKLCEQEVTVEGNLKREQQKEENTTHPASSSHLEGWRSGSW